MTQWSNRYLLQDGVARLGLCLLVLSGLLGCNPHPVQPLEGVVSAVNRQSSNLPAKTKIDFLFVMDNSGSMAEEQANLSANFRTIAEFLSELGPSADYRVAVTSMDLGQQNQPGGGDDGKFMVSPDPALAPDNCEAVLTAAGINEASPVLLSDGLSEEPATAERQIIERFACMATIGKNGSGTERGLEAMRKALSCNQPNSKFFAQCCVPDPNDSRNQLSRPITPQGERCNSPGDCVGGLTCVDVGGATQCTPRSEACPAICLGTESCVGTPESGSCQTVVDNRRKIYNPVCEPEVEPLFLRPDALLVVILVTDENDCSAPRDNRSASSKVICRYNIDDTDGNGVPDGYNDPALCPSRNVEECFRQECGALAGTPPSIAGAQTCFDQKCQVNFEDYGQVAVTFACEYESGDLTNVGDYFSFLTGLKAQPREQLILATIAGPNKFTPGGKEVYYVGSEITPMCVETLPEGDPDTVLMTDVSYMSDACCPDGQCRGAVRASCFSANGNAYPGRRYQKLVGALGENGIGCPNVDAETVTDAQRGACAGRVAGDSCNECGSSNCSCMPVEGTGELACGECVNICANDFSAPLDAIRSKVTDVLGTYCLDKTPACLIQIADDGSTRACEGVAELNNPANYQMFIRADCNADASDCIARLEETRRSLAAGERWTLYLNEPGCSGGALVKIEPVPPAGSIIDIEFFVATDEGEVIVDGGVDAPSATSLDAGSAPAPMDSGN
jgi:hypothetical protein